MRGARPKSGLDWRFVLATMGRGLLPLWFLTFAYAYSAVIVRAGYLGVDFRIYYRATHLWLAGGDPWSAVVNIFSPAHFGAPPLSLLPVVPFMLLNEDLSAIVFVAICALSGIYVVRRLRWVQLGCSSRPSFSE